jgi:NAD-dependent DNA ligase
MNICFTGCMVTSNNTFIPRAKVRKMIEEAGHVLDTVLKPSTDILVSGKQRLTAVTAKVKKAEALGIRVVSCDDAVILLNGGGSITTTGYEEEL